MSYNGSGTFVVNSSGQPVVTGTVISSTAFNALTADLATGLSTAITKDGQTTTTSRILFAQGISSTLVTDATSSTTGSIITAGGISTQKALWVGTTANVAGTLTGASANFSGTLAVVGASTLTNVGGVNNYMFTYGFAKTDTSRRRAGNIVQSTDATPWALSTGAYGGAADANRIVWFQTGTDGTSNAGNLCFQDAGGNVGIGLGAGVAPSYNLHVGGTLGVTGTLTGAAANFSGLVTCTKASAGDSLSWTNGGATPKTGYLYSDSSVVAVFNTAGAGAGRYGIQITANSVIIDANAGAYTATFNSSGLWKWSAYGAGTITSDASGNLTAVSDPSQKLILGGYKDGLVAVIAASSDEFMGWHKWRPESGMETEGTYASFFAADNFPIAGAVAKNGDRPNSFNDRPVLMATVNAITELASRLATLEARLTALENK